MEENKNNDLNELLPQSFNDMFRRMEAKYGRTIPPQAFSKAFSRAGIFSNMMNNELANANEQNDRVKHISSLPIPYTKNDIVDFLKNPDHSERELRQVANSLEYTAYPFFKLRKTYQDIMSCKYYSYPAYIDEKDAKSEEFLREWRLVDKINTALNLTATAHEIAGQVVRDGKVFYAIRYDVDKAHNNVYHCFLQQLPQDWVKIVGFNNVTKYTIAFDLMYFAQPGTDPAQFGSLFDKYLQDFREVTKPRDVGKKVVYASANKKAAAYDRLFKQLSKNNQGVEIYYQSGRWFYWVTLDIGSVWTFEADDVSRNVLSPLIGLALSMAQIAQYESVQLELVQNPLIAVLTGEIEYEDTNGAVIEDAYKLSPSGRAFFEALWYRMMSENNTSGIGFFAAPLKNMHLEQLAEAPSATEISANGYSYAMMKSGNGLLPLSTEPRVGAVNISAQIEAQFVKCIYYGFERMMNWLYQEIGMKHEWRFHMFGDIFSEDKELERCRQGMTLGILPDTLKYCALIGHSLVEDLSISNAIIGVGIMDKRIPLQSSYNASGSGDKPSSAITTKDGSTPKSGELGGRPKADVTEIESEYTETKIDQ